MNNSKHCELCDLQSFDIKDGVLCSLTDKKGSFKDKCSDIKLNEKLKETILNVNKEFEDSKYVRKLASGNMVFYGIIGIAILYFCYYLSMKLLSLGIFHTATIVIFSIGLSIIGMGVGALNYSKQKWQTISPKKENLDKLTDIYGIKYQFDSKISTDMMGIKHTKTKLIINGETIEKIEQF